jgi:hypothetical protein
MTLLDQRPADSGAQQAEALFKEARERRRRRRLLIVVLVAAVLLLGLGVAALVGGFGSSSHGAAGLVNNPATHRPLLPTHRQPATSPTKASKCLPVGILLPTTKATASHSISLLPCYTSSGLTRLNQAAQAHVHTRG